MSEHKKEAKAASAAKMQRMGLKLEDGSKSFTDERGGSPFEGLNSGNAGQWPITPSRFKRGGKVGKHVGVDGEKAHKNLGKASRVKKAAGGSNMPVPMPPRRDDPDYNPYPYKLTKAQQAALYAQENPNTPSRIDNDYASGGIIGATPAQRKKMIGAMVARKKREGISSTQPKGFGVPRDIKAPIGALTPMKKGGRAHTHEDEAKDRALIRKEVKPSALKHRAEKCWGGEAKRSKKFDGGGITPANAMMQRPGMMPPRPMGGPAMAAPGMQRPMRATGGRTKGKTNVNIIISPQSGQQGPLGAGVGMGMPPVPPQMPPMPPQMPPQSMPPMPPGGAPGGAPQLPPQLMAALAARGGAGGPPMGRKTGGRVDNRMPKYQEKDYGSGSGLGRLEKRKWPTADGTE